MDKQKQIEEMANDICDYVEEHGGKVCLIAGRSTNPLFLKASHNYGIAEMFVEKNYHKGETVSYQAMVDAQNVDRWQQGYEQGKKEAAEKYFELLKERFYNTAYWMFLRRDFEEICKQITGGEK